MHEESKGGYSGGMGMRGVTRPMEEHKHHQKDDNGGGHHEMSDEHRRDMLAMHHKQTLWVYWMLVILGFWMLVAPATFGHGTGTVSPSGGRSVWLSLDARVTAMTWSDIVSGLLLIVFGWRSLTPNRPISLWICCFVGVWLNFAPLIFWAPTAAAYLNDTIVGMLVCSLTVLIAGMPNMIMYMQMGGDAPPGWTYNPSSWPQRWIMIVTGFAGLLVSRYLAAFQLGYIDAIWDPFFGDGTRQVLNSDMSHMWPISDGGLGAFSYTFEFLMGFMGSPARWRTMPWMVTIFGILVIPLGLTHIFLVISQPVIVGHWCTMCLLAAGIMLPMIPLEMDEVVAMIQHLIKAKRKGDSVWRAFWKGSDPEGSTMDERSPELISLPQQPWAVFKASIWGMSFPWTLVVTSVLGIWMMFAPTALGTTGRVADIAHLGGALVLTVSVISMGEVIRTGRYINVILGAIIAIGPWFFDGETVLSLVNSAIVGVAVIGLSIPRGQISERYGTWTEHIR